MSTLSYAENHVADSILIKEADAALRLALSKGEMRGRGGWHKPEECRKHHLRTLMDDAAEKQRWDLVACYANMLYVRQLAGEK